MARSRTRNFRRSVIQVAAAFAAFPACGRDIGGTGENPDPKCEDSKVEGCMPVVDCEQVACNPPVVEETCPVEPPSAGASCAEGLTCTYDSCSNALGVSDARCVDGAWELGSAPCNPPPPPETCPEQPPEQGAPCGDLTLECDYDSCTNARGAEGARCVDYAWQVDEEYSCNPPPPDLCPEQLPAAGTGCELEGQACRYGDSAELIAECVDLTWEVRCDEGQEDCQLPSGCPLMPPSQDAPCSHVGDTCGYYECAGAPTLTADCVNGSWQTTERTCNPPPVEPWEG